MKKSYMFSVIVPIYNVELYLTQCLESIVAQSYKDYEVILIDDCSTDASYNIAKHYNDRYDNIRIYENIENKGLSFSRNFGINNSCGDYLVFVDSDDYVEERMLETINREIAFDNPDMLFYLKNQFYKIGTIEDEMIGDKGPLCVIEGQVTGLQYLVNVGNRISEQIPTPQKAIKRDFLISNDLYFENGLYHEDVLFNFQCLAKAEKVKFIPERLYNYRRRGNSITTTISKKRLDSLVIVLRKIYSAWSLGSFTNEEDKAVEAYIKMFYPQLRMLQSYFPDYARLSIGTYADQFFFSMLRKDYMQGDNYVMLTDEEIDQVHKCKYVILFGAGSVGSEVMKLLSEHNISITAICVTNKDANPKCVRGIKVYSPDELLDKKDDAVVLISVVERSQNVIDNYLDRLGFKNRILVRTINDLL